MDTGVLVGAHGKACGRCDRVGSKLMQPSWGPAAEPCVLSHGSSPSGRSRVWPREAVVAWHVCQRTAYLLQGPPITENETPNT